MVISMMVKIRDVLNPLILDAGWVGFNGDSEYEHPKFGLMMGGWTFHEMTDDEPTDNDWDLDDEIPDEALYKDHLFKVINGKGAVCIVQFHYYPLQRFTKEKESA